MKKHFLIILIIFMFFFSPSLVKADFGDVRYEVTDVNISGYEITFKGWAFIHKTNNYIDVEDENGKVIKDKGDQKVIIQAYDGDKLIATASDSIKGDNIPNYNFYCEFFYKGSRTCDNKDNYLNTRYNNCTGVDDNSSQCYYEDIYFSKTFDVSNWNVSNSSEINFKIAVSNADFEAKYKNRKYNNFLEYNDDVYTKPENLSIADASISNYSNDYIKIDKGSVATSIRFIAHSGLLLTINNTKNYFNYGNRTSGTYGAWNDNGKVYSNCGGNVYKLYTGSENYPEGRGTVPSSERCYDYLGSDCIGSHYYAIKVKNTATFAGKQCPIACPSKDDDYVVVLARGSHVKPVGTFKINIINDKKCDVTNPLPNNLNCNSSGTLSSTCEELTVNTSEGRANVKIEQTGTVSTVLTPDSIYAGGGFKFGIMYYNTIKWSYVGSKPSNKLHAAVNAEMNKKIKDYESYIAGINIINLKFGNTNIESGMIKKCTTSSSSKNYYGRNGLTVSCVFTFPDSIIDLSGNVKYTSVSSSSLNINNKYYTPINKTGKFNISATITGMDRITENSSKSDSADKNSKPWTGTWIDSIDGCVINLYDLFYKNGKYNFIYRPIDIYNPFPNRNAGINWFDWYNISGNRERLENTYLNDSQYTATLDNNAIVDIKNYNKDNNYLDWDSIDNETGESSFITGNDYIVRGGN